MKNRIKQVRELNGHTQSSFANILKISRSAICKIESGENSPSEQTIEMICKNFNINKDWLRTGSGEMNALQLDDRATYISYLLESIDDPIANEIMHFMQIYLDLDEKDKTVLRNLVSKLHEKRTGK